MKRFGLYIYIICVLSFVSCGGKNNDVSPEKKGSIYGCVTDFATGNPVYAANVQLRLIGETTLTGSDGKYEFPNIEDGNYSITVSKAEYTDLIDDYVISVKSGRRMRRDVQLPQRNLVIE